ncbi:hypothetical protein [Mixta intestinalis]|uniref:Uncharacterized protein n=1 Tax=Mixta intestinalis TaxID=1615494 RepID=A0A6P1Q135_9GAMM|nr:hypothetical protein [Mixta intestinalis]QHM72121.1 hypothetical protein C7M51_02421 [Mixta intestinalis]
MDMLLSLPEEVTMMGLWLNSEQQNEVCANNLIENNSLSLFFSATTKRPIFHILALKERLKKRVCDFGPDWIATRSGNVHQLLLLNTVTINPQLSVQQNLLNDYSKCFHIRLALSAPGTWRIKNGFSIRKMARSIINMVYIPPATIGMKKPCTILASAQNRRLASMMNELIRSG